MVAIDGPDRNRGQLILVGCLTLAFVILSIGFLINTTLYTESASPALSNAQIDDATTFHYETRRGTRSLIHRVNHGDPVRDQAELGDNVTATIDEYSGLLAESYASTEPASVDVSYNHDESEIGTRVIQRADGEFDENIGIDDGQRVGWFAMNVNVTGTNDNEISPFEISIDGSDEDVSWEVYRNGSSIDPNLTVRTTYAGTERTAHCNPRRNRVLIDGMTGEVIADQCWDEDGDPEPTLHGIRNLDAPHEDIGVSRPEEFSGKWELVANGESWAAGDIDSCDAEPSPAENEACRTSAVWTANVTTTYDGQQASFARDRDMDIYGGDE